jgi:ribonucleoside-diphosphate reductase alpha chain
MRFEPAGFTSNPDVPIAKPLIDYVFRYLGTRFLTEEEKASAGLLPSAEEDQHVSQGSTSQPQPASSQKRMEYPGHPFNLQSDAPACHDCGAIMVRSGSCYKCLNCGATNGCS